jgi:hypothetical protein
MFEVCQQIGVALAVVLVVRPLFGVCPQQLGVLIVVVVMGLNLIQDGVLQYYSWIISNLCPVRLLY